MKEGALDFLAKPVDPDHLLLLVERALSQRRLATENILLKEELAARRGAPQIVGEDAKLKQVTMALQRAATTDATVLLEGESGTGKELFARALHALSPRADGPFVAINCAAIPENAARDRALRPREGRVHRRRDAQAGQVRDGAPRHAVPRRDRRSAACRCRPRSCARSRRSDSSASAAPPSLQVDVRVVAATNRNLKAAVAARQYREDLYFRLSVFPITIPPLRERADDIPMLAQLLHRSLLPRPEQEAADAGALAPSRSCVRTPWPGNVRELQNCIERAVILTEGDTIHARHLNLSFREPRQAAAPSGDPWDQIDLSGTLAEAARRVADRSRAPEDRAGAEGRGRQPRPRRRLLQFSYKMLVAKLREYGSTERQACAIGTPSSPSRIGCRACRTGPHRRASKARRYFLNPTFERRLHFLLGHVVHDRRRADGGRQHEVQPAGDHLLVVLHRLEHLRAVRRRRSAAAGPRLAMRSASA